VLYEMLTGNPPHTGASAQQIIMKIITEPAEPVTKYRKSVPPNVAAAVAKSLEKLPADRFESAKAFADALGNAAYTNAAGANAIGSAITGGRGVPVPVFVGSVVVVAAAVFVAALWGHRASRAEQSGSAVRFPLTLAPDIQINTGQVAISPDGKTIAFNGSRGGVRTVYLRGLGDPVAHPIPGTDEAGIMCFSPDGKWIAFFSQGQVKKVQLSGGAVVPLGAIGLIRGITWTKDDVIIVGTSAQLMSVPATGGTLKPLVSVDTARGEISQRFPLALDDGETVLFTSWQGNIAASRIAVFTRTKGTTRLLELPGSTAPLAVLDGKLVYAGASGSLMSVPFDARAARVTGTPVPVLDGVAINSGTGSSAAAVSQSGSLVYQTGNATSQLVLADMNGRADVLVAEPKNYSFPRFSPDGKKIAFGVRTPTSLDVWLYDVAARTPTRLTSEGNADRPEWTPDGKRVLYLATNRHDQKNSALWWQPADGSGTAELVQSHPTLAVNEGAFSPDGHILAYRLNGSETNEDLWYRRLDGDTTSKPIAATRFTEWAPRFSPDGRWVAYTSDQSGRTEVYVQAFPALAARYPVTAGGGQAPIWSRDGRHIYYIANGQMSVATVSTTPAFAVTSRQQLFEGSYALNIAAVHAPYDISPDGQHILLIRPTSSDAQTIIVHDWKYELRERTKSPR
jgi:eukaryotic-like serine/threonine-protein kinase